MKQMQEVKFINCESTAIEECTVGVVVGHDYDIGTTIVEKSNPKNVLLCLVGPSSNLWKPYFSCGFHRDEFELVTKEIMKGQVDCSEHLRVIEGYKIKKECGRVLTVDNCPYNQ